jgi:hypothetical protein
MPHALIERRRPVSPWESRFAPYVAGFLDGDGCIIVNMPSRPGRIAVIFTNANLKILQWLQKIIGGKSHITSHGKALIQRKQTYNLTLGSYTAVSLLQGLEPYLYLKRPLAQQAIWYHHTPMTKQERHAYRPPNDITCTQEALCLTPEGAGPKRFWAYYAGFFDAEGSLNLRSSDNRMALSVAQNHACVLTFLQYHADFQGHIQQLTRHGVPTNCHQLVYTASSATSVCKKLLPHLRIKAVQASLFIAFRNAYEQGQRHLRPGIEAQLRALTQTGPQGQLELFPLHNLGRPKPLVRSF